MGFDKAKAIRAAEKYLAQNKISSAIQEYRRIVENDATDFNALNMLGDLYVRVDKKQDAVTCFMRVAEHYQRQGFALKAIAVYKKVTRFVPDSPEVASALGLLYEQQGLIVDARAQYLLVADAYARQGQTRESLDVLRRIADLDPNNIPIRLRLAESLLAEGLHDMAAEAFTESGDRLLGRNEFERALDAYTKSLAWRPHSHAALSGMLSARTALGTAEEAVEVLEKVVRERPGDLELHAMLVRAYLEAENASGAKVAVRELASRDSTSYLLFFDVARLLLQQGNTDETVEVLASVLEPALSSRKEEQLLELLQEVLARDPEQIEALRMLVRVHTWQRDDDRLRITLENLAETAETLGLADEEREALAQLVRLAPYETAYLDRLQALGGVVEDEEQAAARLAQEASDAAARSAEVPTFESFMLPDESSASGAREASTAKASTRADSSTSEFEWNSVGGESAPPERGDASASFADLNDFTDTDVSAAARHTNNSSVEDPYGEADGFGFTPGEELMADAGQSGSGSGDNYAASVLAQELESVDFYLEQGYTDIARDTLDMLERQYGAQTGIQERRQRLALAGSLSTSSAAQPETPPTPPSKPAPAIEPEQFQPSALFETQTAPASFDDNGASAGQSASASATTNTTSTPVAPASVPPTVNAQPASASGGQQAARGGLDPGLAAIFDEFREAVEEDDEPSAQDEDYETHYNLGVAYQEMELLDQAIEEFQAAAGLISPRDGTPRYLHCCNLLGHCFMRKEMHRAAAMWFRKGLETPNHTEDEYQALRYELGTAYEKMGELTKAIDTFTEVYGIDVSYRGVAEKLRDLQAQRAVISDQ